MDGSPEGRSYLLEFERPSDIDLLLYVDDGQLFEEKKLERIKGRDDTFGD